MPRSADLNPVGSGLLALASAGNVSSMEERAAPLFDCQSCGACCSYSSEWPRFST
ncbi:MAG: YkgJ family cysteine cluster protein, partial [Mesorhizobium sp.]